MLDDEKVTRVLIWGGGGERGAYVLLIGVERPLSLVFGRYRGGRPVSLPAGWYLYVGSAMRGAGSTTLARRLLRHATRSGRRPPHSIREELLGRLREAGLGPDRLRPPQAKRLHWHVDYLLDEPAATLEAVLAIRSDRRYEERLADLLARQPQSRETAAGLGATDAPGRTHLLRLEGGEQAWRALVYAVRIAILNHEDNADPCDQDQ